VKHEDYASKNLFLKKKAGRLMKEVMCCIRAALVLREIRKLKKK